MTARRSVKAAELAAEILPGTSPELLAELHLLTRDGDLNADARRKLKQINHLVGLLRPAIADALARHADPLIVDCGSGKGYLGFLLYALILGPAGRGRLVAIESREDLARGAAERAARLGMDRFTSICADIASAQLPGPIHVLTALHACDTATDDALLLAIRGEAEHVAVVPCCQAEVARQLGETRPADVAVASLCAHPWHRREFGSHLTNVLRSLTLEAQGYRVTVTELAGWEHSLKNELILGKRTREAGPNGLERLRAVLAATGVRPKLVRDLGVTEG